MKMNFNVELQALDGTILKDEMAQIITLKNISINALLVPTSDKLSGEEKMKRYSLAKEIYSSTSIDMTVEDISLVKKLIGDIYPQLIVGQAWALLEGRNS